MRILIAGLLAVLPVLAVDMRAVYVEFDSMARKELWPGFKPDAIPVAAFDGSKTWLRNHPAPPAEYSKVEDLPQVYTVEGLHPSVRANTSIQLAGTLTATAMLDRRKDLSPKAAAALLMHECFHVYQRTHKPKWQANEGTLFTYPFDDAQAGALAQLEFEALRRAVAETGGCWASHFAGIRRERFAHMRDDAVQYERLNELNEGLAQYIEDRAYGRPPDLSHAYGPTQLRARLYATGSAIATLLDRGVADWKERVVDSLDALIPRSPSDAACAFSDVERRDAVERAQTAASEIVRKRAETEKAFDSGPGWRVIVEAEPGHPLMPGGFDPLNVERLSGGKVLHTRWLKVANEDGSAEALRRRSVTLAAGAHPLWNGVRTWTVLLDGKPAVKTAGGVVEIEGQGFTLKFSRAAVEDEGETITVRLGQDVARQ
jgi:hypothetical protein